MNAAVEIIKKWVQSNRQALERDLGDSPRRRFFSPATYSQYQVTLPAIRQFAQGRLIDLGCGYMPFRRYVMDRVSAYDSLDLYPRTMPTYVGDVQDMPMIATQSYDTAICLEVLEHVPDPLQALQEIYRILKPAGILVVSVPHLSRLHDEPHDYYRFTRHGLCYLLEKAKFTIVSLDTNGGLFSFLGHQMATFVLGLVWPVPLLKEFTWWLNSWLITRTCYTIDRFLNAGGIYAMGYTVVARKGGE